MAAPKEYGLIKRGQNKDSTVIKPRLSIFDDDDGSDEDGRKGVGKTLKREADRINSKKQVRLDLQSALAEDPTVFEYDTVYDDMVQKKNEEIGVQKKAKVKKSRYIDSLMKAAKSRKLDQERATERKVQKERLAEGEMFSDKEAFVTSAYKKKMQEMQEQEEKDRHQAQIEALTDVTKQKDLSGFYRQLYKQTLGPKEEPVETTEKDVSENEPDVSSKEKESPSSSQVVRKPRQFRKRKESTSASSSEDESEAELQLERQKAELKRKKLSEKSTSEDEVALKSPDANSKLGKVPKEPRSKARKSLDDDDDDDDSDDNSNGSPSRRDGDHAKRSIISDKENKKSDKDSESESKKPKISARDRLIALFTKRNVGDAFEAARQRFLERRNARNAEKLNSKESAE